MNLLKVPNAFKMEPGSWEARHIYTLACVSHIRLSTCCCQIFSDKPSCFEFRPQMMVTPSILTLTFCNIVRFLFRNVLQDVLRRHPKIKIDYIVTKHLIISELACHKRVNTSMLFSLLIFLGVAISDFPWQSLDDIGSLSISSDLSLDFCFGRLSARWTIL